MKGSRDFPVFLRLRIRLTAACSLVTGLVLLGMALASLAFSEAQLRQRTEDEFNASLDAILLYLGNTQSVDQSWLIQTETSGGLQIRIEDKGRPLLYGSGRDNRLFHLAVGKAETDYGFSPSEPPTSLLPQGVIFPLTDGAQYLAAVKTVPVSRGGWLGVTVLKPVPQIWRLRLIFGGCALLAFLCLAVFSWYFTARAIRPVEESRKQQTEFVSAASHELRSPLAVMQASADAMQDAPPEQAKRFARTISEECARLSRLNDDLLLLAGADNGRWTMEPAWEEPETILLSVYESFGPMAVRKKIILHILLPDDPLPKVRCDSLRIRQLLAILLDNALSYTPAGGRVTLQAAVSGNTVHFIVKDNGSGIPDSQKRLIFQRFYRADSSRSKKEHYGLGLSIAKEIAQLHKGSLTVEDAPGGGASFTLSLLAK